VLCALVPEIAAHADHFWELSGLFDHADRPEGDRGEQIGEFDSDLFSLSATHYFRPVEESSGPVALAAFLDPHTQLSFAAGEEQTTTKLISTRGPAGQTDQEIMEYSLRGLYLFPESKWHAGGVRLGSSSPASNRHRRRSVRRCLAPGSCQGHVRRPTVI
jgi:hypothetical protein